MQKLDTLENHNKPIILSIGSNLGNRIENINVAKKYLGFFCKINKISKYYETESWPDNKYPKFLNIALSCTTDISFKLFFKKLKIIERKLGRKNSIKNFPRTCDIDIIDFRGLNCNIDVEKNQVICPHPRSHLRNFVLFPIFEIEKNWFHPKKKQSVTLLLKKLHLKSLSSIKIFSI